MAMRRYDAEMLKRARPLSEVVRESGVELHSRWSGRGTHKALCPFHTEKTPSLLVDDRDGHYHCFGCGAHGDVFDYVQRLYNLSFREACERLGGTRSDLPQPRPPGREVSPPRRWDRLTLLEQETMNVAAGLYHQGLRAARGAQAYLRERCVETELARDCALGYSDGRALLPALSAAGREYLDAALSLGLLRDRGEGATEFLTGRLIIPEIRGGNCIWMIGRALAPRPFIPRYLALDGEKPLLGWERAAGKPEVVLTEGPFDYLAALDAGYAAASLCGTSIAPERLGFLARAERVYVALDGDDAGLEGAEKLREVLGGRYVRVTLPLGSDLGDVVRLPGGRTRVRELIEAAPGGSA
ncbi:MAG: CHC2 zinc finger domain-containing protein [Chloroflexota bacterium]|nr:CHC2 zinc finger domain-containing protein [Chloroflexota bacterium]